MKVSEAVEHMTKSYLHRIIDSFTKDLPKPEEERAREIIVKNAEELTDPERTRNVLTFEGAYEERIVQTYVLEALINRPEHLASEEEIIEEVTALEQEILDRAAEEDALRYENARSVEILKAVLEVALEDEHMTFEELALIRRLREKLGIGERSKRIILAQLGHFPRPGNRLHTSSEFRDDLIELQRRGIVFYLNRLRGGVYLIPEEVVDGVKRALEIDITRRGWSMLLDVLTRQQMATFLAAADLPRSGSKAELTERIIQAELRPRACLDALSSQDLYGICKSLPGAKVSGSKDEKIQRLIDYFDDLVVKDVPEEAPPGERFYHYLAELARRDRESLLANGVISKDREMDSAFEEGTRYLFREKLGIELLHMEASDHCDGCMEIGRNGDLLMWDNKSKESVYDFPESHVKQFKRYIRDAPRRVSCFLVVVPEIGDGAALTAARLKVQSGTDTDIALIRADDLVWVAETWLSNGAGRVFDPEVFNQTGVLDRGVLEQRMKLFL
jgi:hypothetical protein